MCHALGIVQWYIVTFEKKDTVEWPMERQTGKVTYTAARMQIKIFIIKKERMIRTLEKIKDKVSEAIIVKSKKSSREIL